MSEYTEEDFKNARFAVLPKYGFRAHRSDWEFYWQKDGIKRATNAEMAEAGWRPVREHNPHATDALEEEIQDLRDKVRDLREAPLTLDSLREAWETAESLEAYRSIISEGDVLIVKEPHDIYLVRPAYEEVLVGRADAENVRVLYRSPRPWQALADVLRTTGCGGQAMDPKILASVLYERGVRVTGGDET